MSEQAAPSINQLLFHQLTEPGYIQNQNMEQRSIISKKAFSAAI